MFGMISQAAPNVCTYMCRESGRSPAMVSTRPCWARLHDDLAAARLRQRQIIKHEQAMNGSKNKTDTSRFARRANRFMNRDDVLVWLSLAWFVALCGGAIWVFFALSWLRDGTD